MPNGAYVEPARLRKKIKDTIPLLNNNEKIKAILNQIQAILDKLDTEKKWQNEVTIKQAYYQLLKGILHTIDNTIINRESYYFENNELGKLLESFLTMALQLIDTTNESQTQNDIIALLKENNSQFLQQILGIAHWDFKALVFYSFSGSFAVFGAALAAASLSILPLPVFFFGAAVVTIIICAVCKQLSLNINPAYSAAKSESQFIKNASSLFANPKNGQQGSKSKTNDEHSALLTPSYS